MGVRRETMAMRLKRLREAAGLTQQELANRAGLSISAVTQTEGGQKKDPKLSTLVALARVLGVSLDEVAGGIAESPPPETSRRRGRKKK
jgi:transcriptional regulator with XRE-family HTH domain